MNSLSVVKLIDRAVLPSVIIVATKVSAIFLGSLIFQIPWTFGPSNPQFSFLFLGFSSQEALSTIINFSDLLTTLVCGIGFTWTIYQANHLNMDYSHPNFISRLISRGREFWLTTTGQAYHQAAGWLGLSWLILFFVVVNTYQGLTSSFVLGIALTITVGLTLALYKFARNS